MARDTSCDLKAVGQVVMRSLAEITDGDIPDVPINADVRATTLCAFHPCLVDIITGYICNAQSPWQICSFFHQLLCKDYYFIYMYLPLSIAR